MHRLLILTLALALPAAAQTPDDRVLTFDFPAVHIGTAEYPEGPTGTTVFYFPKAVKGAIDVRGGAPGTVNASVLHNGREEALVDAVVFSGGSWYGLSAATGAANAIKERKAEEGDRDFIAGVVGAIIYDVGARRFSRVTPDHALGAAALRAAAPGRFPLGAHGAGRFTMQGWAYGPWYHTSGDPNAPSAVHSGQGGAFRQVGPTKVAVFTVVNPMGTIVDRNGRVVRCHRNDPDADCPRIADLLDRSLTETARYIEAPDGPTPNTTITLVVTNQKLEFTLLQRLAMQVHTSMGRAIQPFATRYDGDVLVAVTTDEVDNPDLSSVELGMIASEVAWDAVLSSVPDLPPVPALAATPPDASTLGPYAGTYAFPGDSRLTVSLQDGTLYASYTGAPTMYFRPEHAYRLLSAEDGLFVVDGPDRDVLRFDTRGDAVTGLTLNPGPWPATATRVGPDGSEGETWTPAQRDVLEAVRARNQAWAEGDFDAFMSATHDRWLRWSMQSAGLMEKADYARFWDAMKANEEVVSLNVDPVEIEVFGNAAVAHFVTTEELIWTAERREIGDAVLEPGDAFTSRLRWSDFLIREDGRWRVVGGHRDKTCLLRDDVNERPDEVCAE